MLVMLRCLPAGPIPDLMPKVVDHDERHRTIAAAACAAIADVGLEGATLAVVARRCELTTGAIAHYFPNKDALLEAALNESYQRQIERMDACVAGGASLETVMLESLPASAQSRELMQVWLAFWGRAIGHADTARVQRRVHARWLARVERELTRAVDTGRLPAGIDVGEEAEALIAQLRGLCVRALFAPRSWPATRLVECVERYLDRVAAAAVVPAHPIRRRA